MGERERLAEQILLARLSRRGVLQLGASGLGAAFLAACGVQTTPSASVATAAPSTAEPASEAPATPSPEPTAARFDGVTLQAWSGGTTAGPAEAAAADWEALTGGKVVVTLVPFAERALKFAGVISAQDPAVDLLYISGDFAGRFGDRLYDPITVETSQYVPATIQILSSDGALRGLPQHSEMELFIYNKTMFDAAGLDADNPPDNWDALYAAAPGLTEGTRFPCAVPWAVSFGGSAFYLCFLNSIPGARFLSDDRTQVLFGGAEGLLAMETIEAGIKGGFFDPNLSPDVEDYAVGGLFNQAKTASQINFAELWGYAVGGDPENFPTVISPEEVGVTIMPGIESGNSGSINGFEGFGINKFGQQKDAALSFLQYMSGPEYQKKLNLTKILPSSISSVLTDPEVKAVYGVGEVLAEQGTFNLDRYASPFDWTPPINEALAKLYRGEVDAAAAHDQAVAGVEEIVNTYLAG
jgi:ABC-type glycerol-3-phosphate transport system substrate-binding protein